MNNPAIDNASAISEVLHPQSAASTIKVLLVDDQEIIMEGVRAMLADANDVQLFYCQDPSEAIDMADQVRPTVILQDLVMPDIDGLMLIRYFRAHDTTREVPLIMLSAQEEPKIKAEAFALGANDYIVKLPDKVELVARIRYHSQSYIRLLERNAAYQRLEQSQRVLKDELAEAAAYVRSLLPPESDDAAVKTLWTFIPSTVLGGDSFGYHWLDDENFAVYLLDVCGHGVGAALLSASVTNTLRSQGLMQIDCTRPDAVLAALSERFPMEQHRNMFFTMWYGVYNKKSRVLTYSSGGHPPAVLVTGENREHVETQLLRTSGLVIGGLPGATYTSESCTVGPYNKLLIFSDGVYELNGGGGRQVLLEEVVQEMARSEPASKGDVQHIVDFATEHNANQPFQDDFSLLEVFFK